MRRLTAVFQCARHLPLSWARLIQSTSTRPISVRETVTFCSHLSAFLLWGPVLQVFPPKQCWISLLPLACHMSRPSHPPSFAHRSNGCPEHIMKLLVLRSAVSRYLLPLRHNYLRQTCTFENLHACSSQDSHPHKTTGNVMVYIIAHQKGIQKILDRILTGNSHISSALNFFMHAIPTRFCPPKQLNSATLNTAVWNIRDKIRFTRHFYNLTVFTSVLI